MHIFNKNQFNNKYRSIYVNLCKFLLIVGNVIVLQLSPNPRHPTDNHENLSRTTFLILSIVSHHDMDVSAITAIGAIEYKSIFIFSVC